MAMHFHGEVAPLSVDDDEAIRAFWVVSKEAEEAGRPFATYRALSTLITALREVGGAYEERALIATEDGDVVGTSKLLLPLADNTHIAYVDTLVPPGQRRRGIGSALLSGSIDLARQWDRNTVIAEAHPPYHEPGPAPGMRFLESHGFTTASLEIHRVLQLPVGSEQIDALAAGAAPYHSDYTIDTWVNRVPDEYVAGFCALQEAFNDEAPTGDLDIEREVWPPERVREREARLARFDACEVASAAFDASGEMVALTDMNATKAQTETGWQGGTLVLPPHRGHRLGLATKLVNLARFQHELPSVKIVHSWNAEENGPMVAINDQLGFRPVEYLAELQLRL